MGDSKLYTAHDIEKMKQKIATYKDTLTSLKTGNSIDSYLFIKNEFNGFKSQISHLEGLAETINEKQSVQIGEYEQQVKQFSVQINSLNQTVEELNQDISFMRNNIGNDNRNDFIEPINAPGKAQDSIIIAYNEEREISFIEEAALTKDQTSNSSIQQSNHPPSFMQLHSLVAKANDIQEAPSDEAPIVSHDFQKKYSEEQHYSKKSFPSTGINPSQLYNSRSSDSLLTTAIHPKKFVKTKRTPIKAIENSALFLSPATSVTEKKETLKESSNEVNNAALIDVVNASIEIANEVTDVAPIDVVDASIGIADEVCEVAPFDVVDAAIEIDEVVSEVAPFGAIDATIEIANEVSEVAPFDAIDASIEIANEVCEVAPFDAIDASIEIANEVCEVAPFDVVDAAIEIDEVVSEVAPFDSIDASIEIANEVCEVAPFDAIDASIEIANEVCEVAPFDSIDASIEIANEVCEVAPFDSINPSIAMNLEVIDISNEMKRQQHKNKETLWLFNIFRKKQ